MWKWIFKMSLAKHPFVIIPFADSGLYSEPYV
jgi:hypothetical protein